MPGLTQWIRGHVFAWWSGCVHTTSFMRRRYTKFSIQCITPLLILLVLSLGDLWAAVQCNWKPACALPPRGGLHSTHPMLLGPQDAQPSWVTQSSPEWQFWQRWPPSSAVCTTANRWRNLLHGVIIRGWLVWTCLYWCLHQYILSSSSGFFLTRSIGQWSSLLSSQPCGGNSRLPLPF